MVVSWLLHFVSPSIRESLIWMDHAVDIWNDLKNRFAQGDLARISTLQMEAATMSQGELSVTEFFTKLRVIWDELDNFRLDPVCICQHKCSCTVSLILSQRKHEDRAMQLLRDFFSLVIQQERQLVTDHVTTPVKTNSFSNLSSSPNGSTLVTCTYCNRVGHQENTCFKKHGFPSQDHRSVKTTNNNTRKICTYCHKTGYTIDVSFKKHGYPPGHKPFNNKIGQIHNVVSSTHGDRQPNDLDQERPSAETVQLTPQQYQILAELFKQYEPNGSNVHINQVGTLSTNTSPGHTKSREDWFD
ncbi:uncharacterized protein LOC124834764 isoform X2 [Vigna umbellata]|uniref:uncharacterized protein LOC124834764 isoform X2 n=1 Tax=Vigna umbellata TaxID=87088 RepID=UPI001F5F31F4|nr:uncharacterized protein LOC124834764 isoform X2 [Vigna umbellata]